MTLDLDALETSFDLVAPRGDELVDTFYARLFAAAPSVEPLFADTDLPEQKKMLLATLLLLRRSLRDLGAIVPKLRELGRRHVAYGVRPEHYYTVGAALLWTLEQGLGDAFTPAVHNAWASAYGTLAAVMIAAAEDITEAAA